MPSDDDRPSLDDPDFAAKLAARARARAREADPTAGADASATEPPAVPVVPRDADVDEPSLAEAAPVVPEPVGVAASTSDTGSLGGPGDGTDRSIYDEPEFRGIAADLPDDPEAIEEFFADEDDEPKGLDRRLRSAIEWAAVIVGALAVALLIKTFLFQAFYIPSESMTPTLNENDRILVYKLDTSPERGDLMVFERPPAAPANEVNELIKRVIALEGETITVRDNTVFIDDQRLIEPYLAEGVVTTGRVWSASCANPQGDGTSCEVAEGQVFMMGDNRGNSVDSRSFGPVDTDLMVGRALVRVWPLSELGLL